jgi:3-oxoacyl-[acyl-carrier protein] reductase
MSEPIPVHHPSVEDLRRDQYPLRGRAALVTGVSRRHGIGFAVARRLAAYGASVVLHHHRPHDEEQAWGADDLDAVVDGVREAAKSVPVDDGTVPTVVAIPGDMALSGTPREVVDAAVDAVGPIDICVVNHARSGGDGRLADIDAAMLDGHWAVDARSAVLLAQAYAARHDDARPGGRLIFMTSGQGRGPMPGEVAYALAKGALAEITATIAHELAGRGIRVNTVNPGPVQTGYIDAALWDHVRPMFPFGRYGFPDDPARLIAWLVTDEADWVTGQVLASEGGFPWVTGGSDPRHR